MKEEASREPLAPSGSPVRPSYCLLHPPEKEVASMRRTTRWCWGPALGALLSVLAGEADPARLCAQACSPETRQIVIPLNGTAKLQMRTKKRIRAVTNPKEGILTIRTVEG